MKRCPNPNCESSFLYGDENTACPFCHSELTENRAVGAPLPEITPADRIRIEEPRQNEAAEFIHRHFGSVECRGRIVEIDHHELYSSGRHKLFHSIFRGEPYQFSNQTIEYTIRVENITDGIPTEVTDFCLYGSYLGRLQAGDQVVVRARDLSGRRVVQSLYNETTSSKVRPGLQLPAWLIRGGLLTAVLAVTAFICELVWLFESGAAAAGLAALMEAVMPIAILCVGIWWMIRSVFPKRR